jgi:hypothetical protein
MKDLVISAIANYLPEKIKIYVESLNKSGFSGDKVMICYNIPNETIEYLSSFGWECYGAELEGHPHMRRLIDMWYFLNTTDRTWNHIITTDVRDIVWQLNPSDWLAENLKTEIICASECVTYENEPWGHKNIHEGYGPMFWDWIKPNTIGNVGVIAGKCKAVKELLMLNWLVSQSGDIRHFTDQSSFNFIIHNQLIRDKISISSDFALQVGTTTQNLKIENDLIMNGDTPYVLVHQYDRNEELNNLVTKKLYK